jgi:hypothetical protein
MITGPHQVAPDPALGSAGPCLAFVTDQSVSLRTDKLKWHVNGRFNYLTEEQTNQEGKKAQERKNGAQKDENVSSKDGASNLVSVIEMSSRSPRPPAQGVVSSPSRSASAGPLAASQAQSGHSDVLDLDEQGNSNWLEQELMVEAVDDQKVDRFYFLSNYLSIFDFVFTSVYLTIE